MKKHIKVPLTIAFVFLSALALSLTGCKSFFMREDQTSAQQTQSPNRIASAKGFFTGGLKTTAKTKARKPAQSDKTEGTFDLIAELQLLESKIKDPAQFNLDTCPKFISDIYTALYALTPDHFDYETSKKEWLKIYNLSWSVRLALRERNEEFLSQMSEATKSKMVACIDHLRDAYRATRYFEDYLAENFSGVPSDFVAGNPGKSSRKNEDLTPMRGSSPWLLINPKFGKVTIRSGDIFISRGGAYTSAAIARIGKIPAQFSHLTTIYIEGDSSGREYTLEEALANPRVKALEAHIEVGTTIRPLKDYFGDGNSRNVLFRLKTNDVTLPHRAAKAMYDYIEDYRTRNYELMKNSTASKGGALGDVQAANIDREDVNFSVPYDFPMNLKDKHQLFCSEIAYVGGKEVGLTIPLFLSQITPNLDMAKRLGVKSKQIFAPSDMELDPQFEVIAEFRNIRKLQSLRIKDQILDAMYDWMSKRNYKLKPSLKTKGESLIAWTLRQMDISSVKQRLPKNMNMTVLNTVFTLDKVASAMEVEYTFREEQYRKTHHGLPMPRKAGLAALEELRAIDADLYRRKQDSLIHKYLSP